MEATLGQKPIVHIKDDKINIDRINEYNLHLQLFDDIFRVSIFDDENDRCLLLDDYKLSLKGPSEMVIAELKEIFDDHQFLQVRFWKKVTLCVKNEKFTLLPASLFKEDCKKDYLSFACDLNKNDEIVHYKHKKTDIINIFAINRKVANFFRDFYEQTPFRFIHNTSAFIEGVMLNSEDKFEGGLYIMLEKNIMTVVAKSENRLIFCNNFKYQNTDDIIYFTAFVTEELGLDRKEEILSVWGVDNMDCDEVKALKKYFSRIRFGKRPRTIYCGYMFDEVYDFKYFDLFSMQIS